jgi:hypothetical protein
MKILLLLLVLTYLAGFGLEQNSNITLVINEFMAKNDSFIQDPNGDYDDWIEIYNYGDSAVDIAGMYLTDNLSFPAKWQVPDNNPAATTIPPQGYLLIWADNEPNEGTLHANFRLSAAGEQIALYNADGNLIDTITYGPQQANVSYGRLPDGNRSWRFFVVPSPAATNISESGNVIISEIMYHPGHSSSDAENIREEYIELFNPASELVNLLGWRFTDGVDFVFPDVTLGPSEYMVVAADLSTFRAKYPVVSSVVGCWSGRLSNSGEVIGLQDAAGGRVDEVRYSDEGDWAVRQLGPEDYGHRGWIWSDEHDSGGKSLELVNFAMSNEHGQNWAASNIDGGTPGAENSTADSDIAPLVLDTTHFPIIPWSDEPVTVSARIVDELTAGITAMLHYRKDRDPNFSTLEMFDDGGHGDNNAGDRIYAAVIPAHRDGTIIEFYIEAADAAHNVRTWPSPSLVDGELKQTGLLYQVSDSLDQFRWPGRQPIYYLIMTEAERAELQYIGSHSNDAMSRVQMNGTFISIDGVQTQVRYLVGIRNRGTGSRTNSSNSYRNNYHVNFPNDRPWNGVTALIINNRYGYIQLLGSAIWQLAGLPAADAKVVQLRLNGKNLAQANERMFGSYVALEVIDSDFAEKHFPDDPAGNAYICASGEADLSYKGDNPNRYRDYYEKSTNIAEDDFNDLINLVYVLNITPPETFVQDVSRVISLEQWLRYLAVDALAGNLEGGLTTPRGDDYALYRGRKDTRFWLLPHDLDTLFGQGDHSPDVDRSIFVYAGLDGLHELMTHPDVIPLYYSQLIELIDTVFSPEQFNPLVDKLLGDWVPKSMTDDIKQFVVQRNAAVLAQMPQGMLRISYEPPVRNQLGGLRDGP